MIKLPHAGKEQPYLVLISGFDYFIIPHGTTGFYYIFDAGLGDIINTIPEREKGIGDKDDIIACQYLLYIIAHFAFYLFLLKFTLKIINRSLTGQGHGILTIRLAAAHPDRLIITGAVFPDDNDGIGLDVFDIMQAKFIKPGSFDWWLDIGHYSNH